MPAPLTRRTALACLAGVSLGSFAACAGDEGASSSGRFTPRATPTTTPTASGATRTPAATPSPAASAVGAARGTARVTDTLASGLVAPWGLALLPDGSVLITSRDDYGIRRLDPATGDLTLVARVPGVVSNVDQAGEAGLLGIAVSPSYADDARLYLYSSTATDNRISWAEHRPQRRAGRQLGPLTTIVDGIPLGVHHDGGRLAFAPDGTLHASTGEAEQPALAQDTGSLGGKILRMTPDGAPVDGPFGLVLSYGYRNVQGLAFDAQGRLFASEFGDKAADELNLIEAGGNYGWPATQGRTARAGYTSPIAQWGTDEDSPSGIAIAAGCVWMAALQGECLWRIPLDGARVVAEPVAFLRGEHGRLRSVLALDDATLLVTTSNTDGRSDPGPADDRVLRVAVT